MIRARWWCATVSVETPAIYLNFTASLTFSLAHFTQQV